jgi:hypothetical protein
LPHFPSLKTTGMSTGVPPFQYSISFPEDRQTGHYKKYNI